MDKINFAGTFGKVRLHGNPVSHLDLPKFLHQLIGTAGNKPRRQNRFCLGEFAFDCIDPAKGGLGRHLCTVFFQSLSCLTVHIDLAHITDKAAPLHQHHQKFRGRTVTGGKDDRAGGGS